MSFNKFNVFKNKKRLLPKHVAIIMDGNGRWAEYRMLRRFRGHERGVYVIKEVVSCCCHLNIPILTLYAFSTENWRRPYFEISNLMRVLIKFLKSEKDFLIKNGIKLNIIGDICKFPINVRKILNLIVKNTNKNNRIQLNLALNYSGRSEIVDMVLKIASKVIKKQISLNSINIKLVSESINTFRLPDPDLLIRTGGEMRISNFLLWQLAYTEFFFTKTLWPDFGSKEFVKIVEEFLERNRKFGSVLV